MNGPTPRHLPRILTKADAAAYCSLTEEGFTLWVRTRRLPGAIAGTRRWDKVAIDLALDRLSGIERGTSQPKPSGLATFLERRAQRKAAEAEQKAKDEAAGVKPKQKRARPARTVRRGKPTRGRTP